MISTTDIPNIEKAILFYHIKPELGNKDIQELFNGISVSSAQRLKQYVMNEMASRGMKSFRPYRVNTAVAYEVWGLDIKKMERSYLRLKRLGILKGE